MTSRTKSKGQQRLYLLAEFRYALREFLHFSEEASRRAGLHPQQHQLLLQLAGAPVGVATTVSYVAERLRLRHHSAVELSQRCEESGLIRKRHDMVDHRCVVLEVTAEGQRLLQALAEDHARELHLFAPKLVCTLTRVHGIEGKTEGAGENSEED